jgi:oxygen-independent coproporphyrinogen-3 oxidase
MAAKRNIGGISQPLSVYVHLPFCDTLCYYCGCNKVVTRDHGRSAKYIKYLEKELALVGRCSGAERRICQLHWGGGTPTFLAREEMAALMALDAQFERAADAKCSIEVDPRSAEPGRMAFLAAWASTASRRRAGLRPAVQQAVHRIQSEEDAARDRGGARERFRSVSLDLIYGLPRQTLDSFSATLDKVVALDPDRIRALQLRAPAGAVQGRSAASTASLPSPSRSCRS